MDSNLRFSLLLLTSLSLTHTHTHKHAKQALETMSPSERAFLFKKLGITESAPQSGGGDTAAALSVFEQQVAKLEQPILTVRLGAIHVSHHACTYITVTYKCVRIRKDAATSKDKCCFFLCFYKDVKLTLVFF